jgi:hypothetical protein
VSARDAYSRAAAGPAARLAPGDLLAARTALDDAEHALSKEHDVDKTRDLAYVAQRKAQLAQARADELAALTPGTQ